MPLTYLGCSFTSVSDLSPLQDCKSLKDLEIKSTKVTPAAVAALQKALPNCKIEWDDPAKTNTTTKPVASINDTAFQAWMKTVAALPAEKQVEAVAKKLVELNPGFDGKVTPMIQGSAVTDLTFFTDNVADISPVLALARLQDLRLFWQSCIGKGQLTDLSPLKQMELTSLRCINTQVSDLSPLRGMPLTVLFCDVTKVPSLAPFARDEANDPGVAAATAVTDLAPLEGMPLTDLYCYETQVSDLGPLKGMPLKRLVCGATEVTDLSPLQGIPLTDLELPGYEDRQPGTARRDAL